MTEPDLNTPAGEKEAFLRAQSFTFSQAKRALRLLFLLQSAIFAGGVVAVFIPSATLSYPWIAFPLAIFLAWVGQKVSRLKSAADECKRKHELLDGLGVKPKGKWLANFLQENAGALKESEDNILRQGITYASTEPPGPRRLLENVVESAWFSHHGSRWCAAKLGWAMLFASVLLVAVLFYITASVPEAQSRDSAARAIAGTFLFIISLGMFKGFSSFQSFSRKADKCDDEATALLASGNCPSEYEALRVLADYQLARASAPMIPTWVWKRLRDRLNKNWKIKKGVA